MRWYVESGHVWGAETSSMLHWRHIGIPRRIAFNGGRKRIGSIRLFIDNFSCDFAMALSSEEQQIGWEHDEYPNDNGVEESRSVWVLINITR